MKVLSAIGARPQFIKAAPVSKALRDAAISEILVHSGQHYDAQMSGVFFSELELPVPDINLGVGSGSHAEQTAKMLTAFERVMLETKPDWVLVHGDTNSTIAAALAAAKLQIPIAHNEAGLRSYNRAMPEEHNRVLTDHCSDLLFCPTEAAAIQLRREGITQGVHMIGDVMYDALLKYRPLALERSSILRQLKLRDGEYILATLHRSYNVDSPNKLQALAEIFALTEEAIVLPCHPRLRKQLDAFSLAFPDNVQLMDPVGYLDMLALESGARLIMTDSGGVQKEAYMLGKPCMTLRSETEWTDTVDLGWNRVVDVDVVRAKAALTTAWWPDERPAIFGQGDAACRLAAALIAHRGSGVSSPS